MSSELGFGMRAVVMLFEPSANPKDMAGELLVKLGMCAVEGKETLCLIEAEQQQVRPIDFGSSSPDMNGLIEHFAEWRGRLVPSGRAVPFSEIRFLAPIPRPLRNILCVGKNYRDHAQEFSKSGFDSTAKSASAIPAAPIIFTKAPQCVIGPGDAIVYPAGVSDKVDYEAELAVVIGTGGRAIPKERAYDHVWGYTIVNDVTARDLQSKHAQWFLGKSIDTFCPMGPWIATSDEIDPENLHIQCWVNDELRQDASTADLIFDIPTLIATISAGMTLYPGDIIATGTPAGVGLGFDPPKFLHPGDRIRIAIDGLGSLENAVA